MEVDETYMGGKYGNMHRSKKPRMMGAGTQDKIPVVAIKERGGSKIRAKVTRSLSDFSGHLMLKQRYQDV